MRVSGCCRQEGLKEMSGWVYGVEIEGFLPGGFRSHLLQVERAAGNRRPELEVCFQVVEEVTRGEEFWVAEPCPPVSQSRFSLFRQENGFGLAVAAEGRGVFLITPEMIHIDWCADGAGAEHYFFSYALPLWLETVGVPVLHASVVAFGDRGVAFLGQSGAGKSTLCAELTKAGCSFVADDGLALRKGARGEWRCSHGPPLLRLWPSSLEPRLGVAANEFPRVHDTLEKRQVALSSALPVTPGGLELVAVYVLDRKADSDGVVSISRSSPRQSLVRLIEHSVAGGPATALGLAGQRLDILAGIVEKVPLSVLSFPSSDDSALRVREAVLRDLE